MIIDTLFLAFWRDLAVLVPGVTLALAARAWRITRHPGEAARVLAPSVRQREL